MAANGIQYRYRSAPWIWFWPSPIATTQKTYPAPWLFNAASDTMMIFMNIGTLCFPRKSQNVFPRADWCLR